MKTLLVFFILLNLLSCSPTEIDPITNSGAVNDSAPLFWYSTSLPLNLKNSVAFGPSEISNIQAMSSAWESAVDGKKDFFTNTTTTNEVSDPDMSLDSIGEDGVFGVYKINHWPSVLSGSALAVTQILGIRYNIGSSSEHVRILHADILLNDDYYDFRTGDSFEAGTYDLRTVMLHELGHFLGLGHKYGNTVMIPSIGSSSATWAPTGMDTTDIADKYDINLGGSGSALSSGDKPLFLPLDEGKKIKILMELMPDGECIHREDGIIIGRHFPSYN